MPSKTKCKACGAKASRSFISRHIKKHLDYGYPQKRAIAAAYSEARSKGYRIKVNPARLKAFAKEEASTSRLYRKLGFKTQSRQEAAHSRFFKRLSK